MEELYSHKNDTVLKFKAEKIYKSVSTNEWNGRDSDELCDFVRVERRVFDCTRVTVFKAVPCPVDTEKKLAVKKQVDAILEAAYLPKYSEHIKVERAWEELCSFEIEDELELPITDEFVLLHAGIRGWYPEKRSPFLPHFDLYGQLWSEGTIGEVSETAFELAVSTIEELGYKLDERYV